MNFTFQRHYRGPLQALIFDWAGTMVDYGSQAPAQIFVKVFKEKGIDVTLEEARGPMGMHKRDHIETMCAMPRIAQLWQEAHNAPPDQEDIEELFQAFIPLQLDILADYSTLIPGALET
ncbi:MAG: phosphonoacetaldehyde hydrolase, partial [Chloroflexota bacterium]